MTLCSMLWVGLEGFKKNLPMLSCWHDLFSFLSPTVLSFSSFHGLVVWGWGLLTDRVFSLSRDLAQRTPINNNNKNTQYGVVLYSSYTLLGRVSGLVPRGSACISSLNICVIDGVLTGQW